jgi:hypothetical protein
MRKDFMRRYVITISLLVVATMLPTKMSSQPRHQSGKQGYSMKIMLNNAGAMGKAAYPPFRPTLSPPTPADSLGLEYPIGQRIEHLFGGGIWIGGRLDTTRGSGTNEPLRLVTCSYEGWAGPLFEMYPGSDQADTIWRASRERPDQKPADWDSYWGGSLPFKPISDQDFYMTYNDTVVRPSGHIPLRLKVVQSSYAWNDPYADAIVILEYKIMNMGEKTINDAFVAFFFEPDVGPINRSQYWTRNFTAYIREARTAYSHNPVDDGSTPVGVALLATSRPLDSLTYTFQWFRGDDTPPTDAAKYEFMSSGDIRPDEYPSLSDTRFLFGFGPFAIRPRTHPTPDTLKIAVAVVSGFSRRIDHRIVLQNNAARALDIYLNQGIRLPATPPSPPLRVNVGFRRIELDWKWRPGDNTLFGRPDPELNWDSTNQVARQYPDRITNPPPGYDSARGGRNFEAYRIWRSENPKEPLPPDESFTLLKQFDVPTDSFEFNTGLQYTFVDSNLVRGKVYVYSVTSLSIPNLAYVNIGDTTVPVPVEPLESARSVNAVRVSLPFAVSKEPDRVAVVPNPYRTDQNYTFESGGYEGLSGEWDENQRRVKFINLPEVCTIRVFSLAGDLVREIHHDGRGQVGGFSRGDVEVPLVSESNRALASGIYLFTVESAFGIQTGKFVIIR